MRSVFWPTAFSVLLAASPSLAQEPAPSPLPFPSPSPSSAPAEPSPSPAPAAREDATEKSAVTPGPLAPARELLGEMLLQMNEPAQALKEFEATLKKEPNRFRALAGAAKAAAASGDRATARKYSDQLVKICVKGDTPGRPELQEARRSAKAVALRQQP